MKKMIFIFSILFSFSANAAFVDGNELYTWLESREKLKNLSITGNQEDSHVVDKDYENLNLLWGYLQGVSDSRNGYFFCLKDDVNLTQLLNIIYEDIKNVPQIRHLPANAIIAGSLKVVFPCPDDNKK